MAGVVVNHIKAGAPDDAKEIEVEYAKLAKSAQYAASAGVAKVSDAAPISAAVTANAVSGDTVTLTSGTASMGGKNATAFTVANSKHAASSAQLDAKPVLSGTRLIAVTAGGKTSDTFTIPFATSTANAPITITVTEDSSEVNGDTVKVASGANNASFMVKNASHARDAYSKTNVNWMNNVYDVHIALGIFSKTNPIAETEHVYRCSAYFSFLSPFTYPTGTAEERWVSITNVFKNKMKNVTDGQTCKIPATGILQVYYPASGSTAGHVKDYNIMCIMYSPSDEYLSLVSDGYTFSNVLAVIQDTTNYSSPYVSVTYQAMHNELIS